MTADALIGLLVVGAAVAGCLLSCSAYRVRVRRARAADTAAAVAAELEDWADTFDMWADLPGRTALRPAAVSASLRLRARELCAPWTVSFLLPPTEAPEGVERSGPRA